MIIKEISINGFMSLKRVVHVFEDQPKCYPLISTPTVNSDFLHALCYVLDPCYHNIPLIMVRSSDTTKRVECNENGPSEESFVSMRISLDIEQMTGGIGYELGAEIIATRYLDRERHQFIYVNNLPKQLAAFHHLIYGNAVYCNNFFDLQNVNLSIRNIFFRDEAFVCPDILKHTQAIEKALEHEAESFIGFIKRMPHDPLNQLTDVQTKSRLDDAKRVYDNTNALYLAHRKHVSILGEIEKDYISHNEIQRDSTYDEDRRKWLTLQETYLLKLEDIIKMQFDELDRLLICTAYQISQETEPLVRVGKMAELIVIDNEEKYAEAVVKNTLCKILDIREQRKTLSQQYLRAQNEYPRFCQAYTVSLKYLDIQNQAMFTLMKNRFHAETMLTAAIQNITSIYSSCIAKQIFTEEEITGNICFEEILAHPDTPKAIVINYCGQGSDFVQLKHEYQEFMSIFQYVLKDILKLHIFLDEQHKAKMQSILEGKSINTCRFAVEHNNGERRRLSKLKPHTRPSYLKPITAYLMPVHNSTVKELLSEFLVLNNSDPNKNGNIFDLVRLHQRTVICIRTGRVYHTSGKFQRFIFDFYTEHDYWLGNHEILQEAKRETRARSNAMRALNANILECEQRHQTLTNALQFTEEEFESHRKEIQKIQKQIDELDSMEFQQKKMLLKWQNNVRETKLKLKYCADIMAAIENWGPNDSEMQNKAQEAAINQMLSLSRVAAKNEELKVIADNLEDLKRNMKIDYETYWKPTAIWEVINFFRNSLLACCTNTIEQLDQMYKRTFEQKHRQSLISYKKASCISNPIEEPKIRMAITAKFCERLRAAARIDKLLVEQLNESHLMSLDNIMKVINRLIPQLFDNKKRRVLLVLVTNDGLQHTYDIITAISDIEFSDIVEFKFVLFDDMEPVVHESKFDKYIALAYYLAACVIGPMRPVIILDDLMKFDVNEQHRIRAVLHEEPFLHHQIFCVMHEVVVHTESPSP